MGWTSETLCALAAVTPEKHSIEIVDENVSALNLDDKPDIVVITVYSFLAPRAYRFTIHALDSSFRKHIPAVSTRMFLDANRPFRVEY